MERVAENVARYGCKMKRELHASNYDRYNEIFSLPISM